MIHPSFLRHLLALAALLSSAETLADAIEASDTLVVTATRSEQGLNDSLAPISVIDRDDIERSQAPDLFELLRLEAGVDIARAGGPGGQTSLFLRGSNSNHVLVLIDGVRVASAATGAFAWENLDPALIERIEIVRGPRAARWGSDAIGGVIQIFTRRAEAAELRAGLGSHGDRRVSAALGGERWRFAASWRRNDGFSSQNPDGFAFDPDDDGVEQRGATVATNLPLGDGRLELHGRVQDGRLEFDQGESDIQSYSGGLDYHQDSNGPWRFDAHLLGARERLETTTAFGESDIVTRRVQLGLQAERELRAGLDWMVGVDGWQEDGVLRGSWREDRHTFGVWTGLDGGLGDLDIETALRLDRDQRFGSELTGNLALGWRLGEGFRLQGSVGRSFRAPNFNQLYSPGFDGLFAGNPELAPETAEAIELGLSWQPADGQQLQLNLFETRIDDLIDFSGPDFQAINIRRARIRGLEISHRVEHGPWIAASQVTWQEPEDRDSGLRLLRRAKTKAAVQIDRRLAGGGWWGLEVLYTSARIDVAQARLDAHTLINLRAGLPLGEQWRLEGRIDNVGDRDYDPLIGFNAPGRTGHLALRWTP
ncbi:TonB-dependent receptor domain-containing protein [Wenzhouxiangella marina]|uniref:Putative tonB-dependent receptor n=1 Tax=Wenzhouxiangella marina TaxID=1579979 RepID=A0A0K0XZ48_9GAMM|nr:TonB-dependent receptor [Wenzhouxiangella marina]AKS42896.1 putative tonB-dependent receptor [Wenzhouxiangella marina]MBB6087421.1 vitamin B12 transporter [Wenzhouxiangella marina]